VRGQTLIDYVAGLSVFVVTLAFVLGLMPSFVTPYQSDVAGQDTAQADRVAGHLVSNLSVDGSPNRLNATAFEAVLDLPQEDVARRYGLREHKKVNLSLYRLNGSAFVFDDAGPSGVPMTSEVTYDAQSAATAVRIVTLDNESATCEPSCRLLVRVW
jgi:hypothetical protein